MKGRNFGKETRKMRRMGRIFYLNVHVIIQTVAVYLNKIAIVYSTRRNKCCSTLFFRVHCILNTF